MTFPTSTSAYLSGSSTAQSLQKEILGRSIQILISDTFGIGMNDTVFLLSFVICKVKMALCPSQSYHDE